MALGCIHSLIVCLTFSLQRSKFGLDRMMLQVWLLLVELGLSNFYPESVTTGAVCLDEPPLLHKLALIAFNLLGEDGELMKCRIVGFSLNSAVRLDNLAGRLITGFVFRRFRNLCLLCR